MKKLALTIAIVLGMTFGAFAQDEVFVQQSGGLFGYGNSSESIFARTSLVLSLPDSHGATEDVTAPLGSGALLLIGFGAAYALKKQGKTRRS